MLKTFFIKEIFVF